MPLHTLFFLAPRVWNCLPQHVHDTTSLSPPSNPSQRCTFSKLLLALQNWWTDWITSARVATWLCLGMFKQGSIFVSRPMRWRGEVGEAKHAPINEKYNSGSGYWILEGFAVVVGERGDPLWPLLVAIWTEPNPKECGSGWVCRTKARTRDCQGYRSPTNYGSSSNLHSWWAEAAKSQSWLLNVGFLNYYYYSESPLMALGNSKSDS